MAMMGAEAVFVDTNVLVYAFVEDAQFHGAACRAVHRVASGGPCWISRQVMREFLATLTRPQPFAPPFPASAVTTQVRHFETRFRVAEDSRQVTERLLALLEQFSIGGKRIHDANIVATMLTHNTKDFKAFSDLITILPLEGFEKGGDVRI